MHSILDDPFIPPLPYRRIGERDYDAAELHERLVIGARNEDRWGRTGHRLFVLDQIEDRPTSGDVIVDE